MDTVKQTVTYLKGIFLYGIYGCTLKPLKIREYPDVYQLKLQQYDKFSFFLLKNS